MSTANPPRAEELRQIWRQTNFPVISKRPRPSSLLVKLPKIRDAQTWLRNGQRSIPDWDIKYSAWQIPQSWFESTIKRCLLQFERCYVIQIHREKQICAPACWNAVGINCECSCMGEHHGEGHPSGRWYEIDETLAVSWDAQKYACRLLRKKEGA